ncbi:MAG: hypothetical protein PGN09_05335 [Sphingomonas fennica]
MPRRAEHTAALAIGAALLAAGVAVAQQAPESILPPGFGTAPLPPPVATPAPPPAGTPAAPAPAPGAPAATPAPAPAAPADPIGQIVAGLGGEETVTDLPVAEPAAALPELPEGARRPLSPAGAIAGYGEAAWGEADGRYLSTLMTRLSAPVASRWMQIALRRALLTRVSTPRGIAAGDWIATRAALLLKLGEADAARMLVQAVDVDRFTPRLRRVAVASALASADPAALCPLPDGAEQVSGQPMWPLVRAMCAALSGEPADAAIFARGDQLGLRPIDEQVAEKVVGAGPASRRAIVLDWTLVDTLTDWRFGLATALGAPIPIELLANGPARYRSFAARAPMLPLDRRVAMAETAAALGVFSSADLVDLYGQMLEGAGDYDRDSPAGRLRTAYVGDDEDDRLGALRAIWQAAETPRARIAAEVLTARAAARIVPGGAAGDEDVAPLVAAMFAAGLDGQAARWARLAADAGGDGGQRAWAMLAAGAPTPVMAVDEARLTAFAGAAGSNEAGAQRTRLLLAALAGLGRLPPNLAGQAATLGLVDAADTPWTRAIDRAAARNEPATVLLLTATAMQARGWQGVPAANLRRALLALRRVGLDGEARMLAAEAMARA